MKIEEKYRGWVLEQSKEGTVQYVIKNIYGILSKHKYIYIFF